MKKVLMATAFAALIASPAFAQGGINKHTQAARTSYAAAQAAKHGRIEGSAVNATNSDVSPYFSTDPDARVRQQMITDATGQ